MFRFAVPELLNLLIMIPFLVLGKWFIKKLKQRKIYQFAEPRLAWLLMRDNSRLKDLISRILLIGSIMLIIFGMARPQLGMVKAKVKSSGLDIIMVVDLSRSMLAADVKPSRLQRAKRALFHLVERLAEHRIGLITFSGIPYINCPLTRDTGALKLLIDNMQSEDLPIPGTNLGSALEVGIEAFKRNGSQHRALVIISDGENFGQKSMPIAKQAEKTGIKIYCLGVGTESGCPVPGARSAKPEVGKGEKKQIIPVTRLDEKVLFKLAQVCNGSYARLSVTGQEEEDLIDTLGKFEKADFFSESQYDWQDYYPLAAGLAVLLLVLEMLLGRRKGLPGLKKIIRLVKPGGKVAVLVILYLGYPTGGYAESSRELIQRGLVAFNKHDLPVAEKNFNLARQNSVNDALSEYNLGCALLAQKRIQEGYNAFMRAKPYAARALSQDNWYNLGYAAFYLGTEEGNAERWQEALEAYKQCLLLNPQDDDARYNLEIILRELKKHTRQMTRQEQQSQGQQGKQDGGGANKPGSDRQNQPGKAQKEAPPSEAQENTSRQQDKEGKTSTSEQQSGKKKQGMSQEDALRTLRSLEAEENSVQKNLPQSNPREHEYKGPDW